MKNLASCKIIESRHSCLKIVFVIMFIFSTGLFIISCKPTTNTPAPKEPEIRPTDPYDKKFGNGQLTYYIFHNFMGQEPDIIPSTAAADTEHYLDKGIIYIQTQYDNFDESLQDRPKLQRYFAQVTFTPEIKTTRRKREYTVSEKMDYYINQISVSCELVMTDIVKNLTEPQEREAFILCYRVLANEAYKEGLGSLRNETDNQMMKKYKSEREAVSALWSENEFLKSVNLENDIENRKLLNTTGRLYTLIHNAVLNMQKSTITEDIKIKDLQNLINLALNESSLKAMHDYTAELLKHTGEICSIESGIVDAMGK